MCCPEPEREVSRVLCTLDVTERAVEYAVAGEFDLILSHHPLVFRPLRALDNLNNTARKLIRLVSGGISVLSFHTRLDAVAGGVNDTLAEKLLLKEVAPFGDEGEKIGRIGRLSHSMSAKEFATMAKIALGTPLALFSDGGVRAHKVAIVGGDGKDFIAAAALAGADTFLTGRASYNSMVEASELRMNIIEAGHFYTEDMICEYFMREINKLDKNIYTEHYSHCEIEMV